MFDIFRNTIVYEEIKLAHAFALKNVYNFSNNYSIVIFKIVIFRSIT